MPTFQLSFFLGSISGKIGAVESREASFKGNVDDVPVNYSAIDKCKTY